MWHVFLMFVFSSSNLPSRFTLTNLFAAAARVASPSRFARLLISLAPSNQMNVFLNGERECLTKLFATARPCSGLRLPGLVKEDVSMSVVEADACQCW